MPKLKIRYIYLYHKKIKNTIFKFNPQPVKVRKVKFVKHALKKLSKFNNPKFNDS